MANKAGIKGDKLEEEVCGRLSNWINRTTKGPALFMRNPGSGAIATKRKDNLFLYGRLSHFHTDSIDLRDQTDYAVGDIAPLTNQIAFDFLRMFAFECKNYSDIPWNQLFFFPDKTTSTHTIYVHWDKHLNDCKFYERVPILIYRESRIRASHPVILIPDSFIDTLPNAEKLIPLARAWIPHFQVYIFGMEDFFNYEIIPYEALVRKQTTNWIKTKLPVISTLNRNNPKKFFVGEEGY